MPLAVRLDPQPDLPLLGKFGRVSEKVDQDLAITAGIAFDIQGNARGAMGIDVACFRNDADRGIVIGNFANEMTALYVSRGAGLQFKDDAIANGLGPQTRLELTFGVLFADIDLDGRLDVVAANGHLEEEINRVQ